MHTTEDPRDPVALAIEDYLTREGIADTEFVRKEALSNGVLVGFGRHTATGPNYDVAFIRLALTLLDDPGYTKRLVAVFRNLDLTRN